MRTAAVRWSAPLSRRARPGGFGAPAFIFPNPSSRNCFCPPLEEGFGNEMEKVYGNAAARRSRGAPEFHSFDPADYAAAAPVRIHLRTGYDSKRLHEAGLQSDVAARHHGDQHAYHGHLGRLHAADLRV